MFDIYKPTQGKHTRVVTFLAGMALTLIGGYWLSERLATVNNPLVQYFVPLGVVLVVAYLLFRLVNRQKMADFLIATEGEMKKVSWSSRKDIIGSTKVVIFATFALAIMLFVVDLLFNTFFEYIKVISTEG